MLDPLPPDIRFEPLLLRPEDVEFSFAAKKEALGPHIRIHWPWDEEYQRRVHRQRFSEKPFFRIERRVEPVGALSWMIHEDHVRFGEFYLFENFNAPDWEHAFCDTCSSWRTPDISRCVWNT
jgi:hypothetical protein